MASVFTLRGHDLGEEENWAHRYPILGLTVALLGPILLGTLVGVAYTKFSRRRVVDAVDA